MGSEVGAVVVGVVTGAIALSPIPCYNSLLRRSEGVDLAKAEQFLGLKTAGTPVPVLKTMGKEIGKVARKRVADFIPSRPLRRDR